MVVAVRAFVIGIVLSQLDSDRQSVLMMVVAVVFANATLRH